MTRVIVILSSGRTGTQFLARYFDANYPQILALHEPAPSWRLRMATNAYVCGSLSRERMQAILARARRGFERRLRGRAIYLESNSYLYGCIEALRSFWGEVEIVHIVRDPRENIRSALNHGNDRGLKRLAGKFVPHWLPDPRRALGLEGSLGPIGRYAAQWMIVNRTIREQRHAANRYCSIRFEDLLGADFRGLRELCDFVGVEFADEAARLSPAQKLNRSAGERVPSWQAWSSEECRSVEAICNPLMREFGYGGEPEWEQKLRG